MDREKVADEEEKDPIKLHRQGTALSDVGKHEEALGKFLRASELYKSIRNYFDASYALFKAAECNFFLKEYDIAAERFLQSADLAFEVGYDRFGLSALEYALDCYKATGKKKKTDEMKRKILKVKDKMSKI